LVVAEEQAPAQALAQLKEEEELQRVVVAVRATPPVVSLAQQVVQPVHR
jgi:hypothetical protein